MNYRKDCVICSASIATQNFESSVKTEDENGHLTGSIKAGDFSYHAFLKGDKHASYLQTNLSGVSVADFPALEQGVPAR